MAINTAKFSIGDVVRHKHFDFRGVIYDVDFEFSNSEEWYQSIPKDVRPRKDQPYYHLLAENNEITYEAYVSEQNLINEKKDGYKPPKKPIFKLSGDQVRDKMFQTLENLFRENKILEHGMEIGKKLAFVLSGGNTTLNKELSEDDMYALELESFVQLIQMEKTQARIKHTLSTGKPLVN